MLASLVAELLRACERQVRYARAAKRLPAVRRVMRLIDACPSESFTLARLASVARLHPTHFARSFRMATGQTIGAYVRARRVAFAQQLLRQRRDDSISRIAAESGFADHAHLTRTFRAVMGMTPSQFRSARPLTHAQH